MPHRRLLQQAMVKMAAPSQAKVGADSQVLPDPMEESVTELDALIIGDTTKLTEETVAEEEKYVKTTLQHSRETFEIIKASSGDTSEHWSRLEKDMVLEFEYTSWPMLSDESINSLASLLFEILSIAETQLLMQSEGNQIFPELVDCAYAVMDVFEGMMTARFIKYLGADLERPFDKEGSAIIFRSLVLALRIVVSTLTTERRPVSLSSTDTDHSFSTAPSDDNPLTRAPSHEKEFISVDDEGRECRTTKAYYPLQYLLTVLYLLSYTSVQTDVTCFWWDPEMVIDEIWSENTLRILIIAMDNSMDRLEAATDKKERALLSVLIDRWSHTLHGAICTDSIGRGMSPEVPDEDSNREEAEKPGIEALTGVSTYLGRWMDVRCLPCCCQFCGVQKQAMNAMMSRWDKRLAHRLINVTGLTTIGRVAYWLLENFRSIESTGDVTGEDLYRTDVALNTQVVHLCILSDYDCLTVAGEQTLRARAIRQAIDSRFLNFLLNYFIPRKLCRLEDRQSETTEDQNKARRLARIACKNCIEFLLLSGDGWITDTDYNAQDCAKIEAAINVRMAPAVQRLIELWKEDQEVCRSTEELLNHYAPFFLKLCEIIRLSTRYGWMKDLWDTETLDGAVSVMSNYTLLKLKTGFEGSLPTAKTLLCAMATYCDMCSPCFGARDHFMAASRAVHDCRKLKELLDVAKTSRVTTSCIRALSYVSRVELVMSVSTKNSARPEQHRLAVCNHCNRPDTVERHLRPCQQCKKVYYCSIECHRQNAKDHEGNCIPDVDDRHKRVKGGNAYSESGSTQALDDRQGAEPTVPWPRLPNFKCAQCGTRAEEGGPLHRCSRCQKVHYCSRNCQVTAWRHHRQSCGKPVTSQLAIQAGS